MLTVKEKTDLTNEAKRASNWFEVELTIKIFGMTILHLKFPPEDRNKVEKCD